MGERLKLEALPENPVTVCYAVNNGKFREFILVISVAARFAADCKSLKVVGADRFHGKLSRQIAV
jgi:hypothetical protein